MTWLFTFLVHSTLWLGLAWLSVRLFPAIHARLRETIWCTALAASLITPTVHALNSPESAVWRLAVPSVLAGAEHGSGEPGHRDGEASVAMATGGEVHGNEGGADGTWLAPAGTLWAALAGGLVVLYLLRLERLRRRLRDREPVTDPRARRALATLGGRTAPAPPPRLTQSHNLGSPVALGMGSRREICVPVRALHELDEGELRALLGHEVAHHVRRDTIRLAMLNVLGAVFFFQPLLRVAVRELRMAAEELCDDWAASQLDDRFAMASCLTEVARWVVRGDRHSPVPCIGRRRSQLERRVRRLLNERRSFQPPSRVWRRTGAVGLLALAPLLAPVVAPGTDLTHDSPRVVEGAERAEHEESREHGIRERMER